MIRKPHNDRKCLGAITEHVTSMVQARDESLVQIAENHDDTASLAAWIRSLPQRDDEGIPGDGPKVEACHPVQRLRVPAEDPNCVERAALYLAVAELVEPTTVRRLATVMTPAGLHTLPTENGRPVVLDPRQSRNALRAGLFKAKCARNGALASVSMSPEQAVDWIAELAEEPAERYVDGPRRVRNAKRAIHDVFQGCALNVVDASDVALMLALAARESKLYGAVGPRIVKATVYAVNRLDDIAASSWKQRSMPRNLSLQLGGYKIGPDLSMLGSLARIGGRVTGKVGLEALKYKLAALGISRPILSSIEQELQREGLSLGPLGRPPSVLGSLDALTPESLAGRWRSRKF